MQDSILEQYRIADFLEWNDRKQLKLSPVFQRRSVWTASARIYLIDTLLRRLPVPKIYMRTIIEPATRKTIREVVDGQQRLRAIIDFARDDFALSRRAGEFAGLRYSTMGDELQERFLTYALAVDQLVNADDNDVLEVFARLNSYTLTLTPPEKRHAKYQTNFKWAVHQTARDWSRLWEDYRIVSVRERVRMADDSLMAEMFGVLLEGVTDGGAPKIDKLYQHHDEFSEEDDTRARIDSTVEFILENFDSLLRETPLARGNQFLMFFAAIAHALHGIPSGEIGAEMPEGPMDEIDVERASRQLRNLLAVLEESEPPRRNVQFWRASSGSTQRISSRRPRFLAYSRALRE